MRRVSFLAFALACCWSAFLPSDAQAPANPGSQNQTPAKSPAPKSTQDANPFPEDTTSVPVMPSANSPGAPAPMPPDTTDSSNVMPAHAESDPVRSPDDEDPMASGDSSSSSNSGLDELIKPPAETVKPGKHGKNDDADASPVHHEGPKEDESVGSYYLDQKNWKAALSRFESALVLDPENPEVYWGLGEAERHLGDYASAKAHYMKLVEYDPDSKHGKEAKKILKQPELANAPAVSSNAPTVNQQQR
jgi:hypothetical protein